MPKVVDKMLDYGFRKSLKITWQRKVLGRYLQRKWRDAATYEGPTEPELERIEAAITALGVPVEALLIPLDEFASFKSEFSFPDNYYTGPGGLNWDEKLLEYMIAHQLCGLRDFSKTDIYLDVAGASSPWASILRDKGIKAYSIDLEIPRKFKDLNYYRKLDATQTNFETGSVRAASMQCAYEMFSGDADIRLIDEFARILVPGGKVVIVPLYMHTHHCGYSSLEYYGKGHADADSIQYLRKNGWGVPFSRKYSAELLASRVLRRIEDNGMRYKIYKLANKEQIGPQIYCHFILEFQKPFKA